MSAANRHRHQSSESKHPEDLELRARALSRENPELARREATRLWAAWRERVEAGGIHPSKRYLAAFLGGYSEPLGGWLPLGMAGYLAKRLDPKERPHLPQGGALPKRSLEGSVDRPRYDRGPGGVHRASPDFRDFVERAASGQYEDGKASLHPRDMERRARALSRVNPEWARLNGAVRWANWEEGFESGGVHPSPTNLAAFLRGYSEPLGGWLPPGVASYLADRLDPEVSAHKPQGGALPKRATDGTMHRFRSRTRDREITDLVRRLTAEYKESGTERPKAKAVAHVADLEGVGPVEVKKALHRHQKKESERA